MIVGIVILCIFFLLFALTGFFCVRFSALYTRSDDDSEQEAFLKNGK